MRGGDIVLGSIYYTYRCGGVVLLGFGEFLRSYCIVRFKEGHGN